MKVQSLFDALSIKLFNNSNESNNIYIYGDGSDSIRTDNNDSDL